MDATELFAYLSGMLTFLIYIFTVLSQTKVRTIYGFVLFLVFLLLYYSKS